MIPCRIWRNAGDARTLEIANRAALRHTRILDDTVFLHFAECDEIWHAGDFGTVEVLDRLRSFKPVRAVYGNVDGAELCLEVPEDLVWDCQGVTVYMTHIGGYPGNYDRRARKEIERRRPSLFICGHSHILKVMRDPALGLIHLNPGACGHHGWHLVKTMLQFTIDAGTVSGVMAIELALGVGSRPRTVPEAE